MYKFTLVLSAFFSLALPILALPAPVPDEIDGLGKRASFSGTVHAFHLHPVYSANLSALRELCVIPGKEAIVVV
jgi:hypothetical protein